MPTSDRHRTYRLSQNVRPLVWVECTVEKHSRSRTEYLVKARSQFKERSSASNVEIFLPLPPDAITPTVRASQVRMVKQQCISRNHQTVPNFKPNSRCLIRRMPIREAPDCALLQLTLTNFDQVY